MAGPSRFTKYPKIFKDSKWDRNSRPEDQALCENMNQFAEHFNLEKRMPLTARQSSILHRKWKYYADHLDRFKSKDGRIIVITSPYPEMLDPIPAGLELWIDLYYEEAETYIIVFRDYNDFRVYLNN
jgi:hypothetical protein